MAVVRPLKVVIDQLPGGRDEWLPASYWPHDIPKEGSRDVPFGRELYIEQDDFMEESAVRFLPAGTGTRGAAPLRIPHYVHRRRSQMTTDLSPNSMRRTTPRPAAATHRTAARSGARFTGLAAEKAVRPSFGSMIGSSPMPILKRTMGSFLDRLNPSHSL
jgi:hypothetical protein